MKNDLTRSIVRSLENGHIFPFSSKCAPRGAHHEAASPRSFLRECLCKNTLLTETPWGFGRVPCTFKNGFFAI